VTVTDFAGPGRRAGRVRGPKSVTVTGFQPAFTVKRLRHPVDNRCGACPGGSGALCARRLTGPRMIDLTLEIWLKPGGETTWTLAKSAEVTSDASQVITVDTLDGSPLLAGWYYDVAVRYRRGPYYSVGYESSNPEDWDVLSQAFFTTTIFIIPSGRRLAELECPP